MEAAYGVCRYSLFLSPSVSALQAFLPSDALLPAAAGEVSRAAIDACTALDASACAFLRSSLVMRHNGILTSLLPLPLLLLLTVAVTLPAVMGLLPPMLLLLLLVLASAAVPLGLP